jgi:hypothetical protein
VIWHYGSLNILPLRISPQQRAVYAFELNKPGGLVIN